MQKLNPFLKLIRLGNLAIIAITMYGIRFGVLYPLFEINNFHLQLSEFQFLLLSLSTLMIAAAGYIINDYLDIEADQINKPDKQVVEQSLSKRFTFTAYIIINFLGIAIAIYLAYSIDEFILSFIQVFAASLLWFYSVNLKHQVIVGNIVIAFLVALVPFTAGIYELMLFLSHAKELITPIISYLAPRDQKIAIESFQFSIHNILYWVIAYSVFAFFITFIREIVKDIEDLKGDVSTGTYSFPVAFGIEKTKNLILFIGLVFIALIIWYQVTQLGYENSYFFYYALILIELPLLYFLYKIMKANERIHFTRCSKTLKIIMLLGILYLPLLNYSILNF